MNHLHTEIMKTLTSIKPQLRAAEALTQSLGSQWTETITAPQEAFGRFDRLAHETSIAAMRSVDFGQMSRVTADAWRTQLELMTFPDVAEILRTFEIERNAAIASSMDFPELLAAINNIDYTPVLNSLSSFDRLFDPLTDEAERDQEMADLFGLDPQRLAVLSPADRYMLIRFHTLVVLITWSAAIGYGQPIGNAMTIGYFTAVIDLVKTLFDEEKPEQS